MLQIRRAVEADKWNVWAWRNDPTTRAASLVSETVSWSDHIKWFAHTISDPLRVIYIGEAVDEMDTSVGMCRFDIDPMVKSAEVSINLNPEHRGKGLSRDLLLGAVAMFHDDFRSVTELTALIRESNIASKKLFLAVGFAPVSQTDGVGSYVRQLTD